MAIRTMHHLPDPVLRQKARRVPAIDSSIQHLIVGLGFLVSDASDIREDYLASLGLDIHHPSILRSFDTSRPVANRSNFSIIK